MHANVDTSFEPNGYSGVGGVAFDSNGSCVGNFSEVVTPEMIGLIKRDDQETIIFELECLAVATALQLFGTLIKGKRVVIFTENQKVQSCLVKCISNNDHMNLIIRSVCSLEEQLGLVSWIERVPSQSKPADELSRERLVSHRGIRPTVVMWHKCSNEKA